MSNSNQNYCPFAKGNCESDCVFRTFSEETTGTKCNLQYAAICLENLSDHFVNKSEPEEGSPNSNAIQNKII